MYLFPGWIGDGEGWGDHQADLRVERCALPGRQDRPGGRQGENYCHQGELGLLGLFLYNNII